MSKHCFGPQWIAWDHNFPSCLPFCLYIHSLACLTALGRYSECLRLVSNWLETDGQSADLLILRARLHHQLNQVRPQPTEKHFPSSDCNKQVRGLFVSSDDFVLSWLEVSTQAETMLSSCTCTVEEAKGGSGAFPSGSCW